MYKKARLNPTHRPNWASSRLSKAFRTFSQSLRFTIHLETAAPLRTHKIIRTFVFNHETSAFVVAGFRDVNPKFVCRRHIEIPNAFPPAANSFETSVLLLNDEAPYIIWFRDRLIYHCQISELYLTLAMENIITFSKFRCKWLFKSDHLLHFSSNRTCFRLV